MDPIAGAPRHFLNSLLRGAAGICLAALVAFSSPTQAQESGPSGVTPILVVSREKLLNESRAAKSIQAQADALRDELRESLKARQEALRAEELELTELRETLDSANFDARVAAFTEKVRELKRDTNDAGARLQRAVLAARTELQQAARPVLLALMAERRALVMLEKDDVVISVTALDVTQEAIDRLDASAPNIDVQLPSEQDE